MCNACLPSCNLFGLIVRPGGKALSLDIGRYEYRSSTGLHVATAAAGRAGKVLLAGGFLKQKEWKARPSEMNRVASTFQLSFPS